MLAAKPMENIEVEHKSCTVMALLDGWMDVKKTQELDASFFLCEVLGEKKKKKKTLLSAPFNCISL